MTDAAFLLCTFEIIADYNSEGELGWRVGRRKIFCNNRHQGVLEVSMEEHTLFSNAVEISTASSGAERSVLGKDLKVGNGICG